MNFYLKLLLAPMLFAISFSANAQINSLLGTSNSKDDPIMPTPSEYWEEYVSDSSFLDIYNSCDVAIFLGEGNTCLTNPVIFVDGFDPGDTRPIEGLYVLGNQQNMIDSLRAYGNDLMLVNFQQGADYIQRNAMLFVCLLDTIQTIMSNNGTLLENPQIVVVGPSMGGLITRYAITYMEQNDMHHHIRNWISFDSPHKGANIPLGLQHWLRFFAEEAESEGAIDGLSKMNSVAAKQMLLYHYSATADMLAGSHPLRNDLVNELSSLGFPQDTRIVAVVNGSGYAVHQDFEPGEQVVQYEYSSFIADLTGNIWAVPNQTSTQIFEGLYNPIFPLDNITESIVINNTLPYDNAPGGDTPTFFEIAEEDPGYGDIIDLYQDHCFIPTISSLCITNTTNPSFNVNENLGSINTPFDTIYFPYNNQEHAEITEESYQWFLLEINNFAPEFTFIPLTEITALEEYELAITANDQNYWNQLEFTSEILPEWLFFDEELGVLSGTPQVEDIGLNEVCIWVNDGLKSTETCFDINVLNVTSSSEYKLPEITIYPNPVTDWLNINLSESNTYNIKLIDITGSVIAEYNSDNYTYSIDTKEINPGVYILVISNEKEFITKRFTKL